MAVNFRDNCAFTATSWQWDFGNGNTSTLQNPAATFLTSGLYNVKLTASDGTQTYTVTKTITVYRLPVVNFTADRINACVNDTLTFTSNITLGDAGIAAYAWGFGNGIAYSNPVTRYIYNQTGAYTVTLVVQDSNGCAANKAATNYIHIHNGPTAAFIASPMQSCNASQKVNFTDQSTGGPLTYFWNLDAGSTSTQQNPFHVYTQQIVNVKETVTDTNGCVAHAVKQIKVTDIIADFAANKTTTCANQKIQFTSLSNFTGTSWQWDFGDGTTSTVFSPIKTYTTPGLYTVNFVIHDGICADSIKKTSYITVTSGFSVSQATFGADSTMTCGRAIPVNFTNATPGGSTFHWDFGNGDTSNLENPTEIFPDGGNYTITLTVMDTNGCSVTGQISNLIQTGKPMAKFKGDTLNCLGSYTKFTNQSSNAQSYKWYFGDGDSSNATNPQHLYLNYGTYSVTLIAYNQGGCDTSYTLVDYVHIDTLHVDFNVNTTFSPCPPFACTLTNNSGKGLKFLWNFGDGYTDTVTNPTHIYFYPGVYTVKLYGTSPQGCFDSITYPNLITVQGPTGTFSVTPTTGCIPLNVNFTATPSGNTKSMWCDLGDGTIIPDSSAFTYTYTAARIYHPQFILTDYVGCSVPYPLDSIITKATPPMHLSDTAVCPGSNIRVALPQTGGSSYRWSPTTNLSCDTCANVSITVPNTITYNVDAVNDFGCLTHSSFTVSVEPFPILNPVHEMHICKGDTVQLTAGIADRYLWFPGQYVSDSTAASPFVFPDTTTEFAVNVYNKLGCALSTSIPVIVKDKVDATTPKQLDVCAGSSVMLFDTLNYSSDLGVTYSWSPSRYLNNPNSANPIATPHSSMAFTLITSSGHCQPDTDVIQVEVIPIPDIEVSEAVTTTSGAEVPLYAASHQRLAYTWYAEEDSFSCTECRRPNFYPTHTQTIYVEGKNNLGCVVRDSVKIEIGGCDANAIYMPNTFTPNGDGINDKFFVRSQSLSSLKFFRVFNQWGELVFQTNNINEGWDGTENGKTAPLGVYVYVLEGKCQNGYDVVKSGNITAIR